MVESICRTVQNTERWPIGRSLTLRRIGKEASNDIPGQSDEVFLSLCDRH